MTTQRFQRTNKAFSLIEVLLVLAIISIMAALVINAFSNASQDSRNVMARQQQATLQSALNNWVSAQIGGAEFPDSANPTKRYDRTVSYVRNKYNYASNWWAADPVAAGASLRTTRQRADLIADYLDDDTVQHFVDNSPDPGTDATLIRSSAMKKTGQFLQLGDWPAPTATQRNPYPKVELFP